MDMAESLPPELGAHDCIEAKQVHAPNSAEPQVAICSSIDLSGTEQVQDEWIEHYEPGVYITLKTLSDGTRDLKRVRFSRKRFAESQAENWWQENREKVYERYNVRSSKQAPSSNVCMCGVCVSLAALVV